jgi:glycosyltransferase involved in cell wall biosynthesis
MGLQQCQIFIITFGNFPSGSASANYLRNLATGLSKCYSVEALLPTGYSLAGIENRYATRIGEISGVKWRYTGFVHSPKNLFLNLIEKIWGVSCLLLYLVKERMIRKVRFVIIKYDIAFSSNLVLLLVSCFPGFKMMNIIPEFYKKPKRGIISLLKWYDFYWGIKYLGRYPEWIITVSSYLKNFILSRGRTKTVIIIPNLVNPEEFKTDSKKYVEDKLTIGYAGTPVEKDGIDDLLKSFALVNTAFPDTRLLIIGDATKRSVIPALKEKAMALKIQDNITFTGLVDFKEVPSLQNACDILALTRPQSIKAEAGFPTKLGEYFACRKPVVVTAVGDIKTYFENTDTVVLAEPGNIQSIADAIKSLIADKEKRIRIGNSGYEWMMQNLEYKTVSKKVHEFIASIH